MKTPVKNFPTKHYPTGAYGPAGQSSKDSPLQKCECGLAQRVVGDGCRYCQPQEYIDRLHEQMTDDRMAIELHDELVITLSRALKLIPDESDSIVEYGRQLLKRLDTNSTDSLTDG